MLARISIKSDGLTATGLPQVRITCSCGWVEKALQREGDGRANQHLHKNHKGESYFIDQV